MSRTEKRKGPSKAQKPRKRLQVSHPAQDVAYSGPILRGDALKWKPVALPQRLDDAEGFYGLEEIEDVDVVRDNVKEHVMFRPKLAAAVESDHDGDAAEDWHGFDDDVKTSGPQSSTPPKALSVPSALKKPKKVIAHTPDDDDEVQADVDFEVLRTTLSESRTDVSAWKALELSPTTLSQLSRMGFSQPTPIQAASIPAIMQGRDVIGKAVTGSGKTLAFGIPIFEYWFSNVKDTSDGASKAQSPILALILAPTRELALQLNRHLNELCIGLESRPRISPVTGGLSIYKQQRQLASADIVVATPGRLWEVMNDSSTNHDVDALVDRLKRIKFLVVDEADRLLSEGHFKEVENILDALDREVIDEDDGEDGDDAEVGREAKDSQKSAKSERQTLVFSATFHKGLQQKLTAKSKRGSRVDSNLISNQQSMEYLLQKLSFQDEKPTFIDVNPATQMAAALSESIVECGAMKKDLHLYTLLMQNSKTKTLVFTNSIAAVKRLTALLQNLQQPAVGLHSTMPQKSRLRSLERFAAQSSILVATDVAARGLDIKGIELVIHYHVPRTADMYVHRSGRTARAESSGRSILLCSPDEVAGVRRLIIEVHKTDKAPETVQPGARMAQSLESRVTLAQKITDATLAREKTSSKDEWLKSAAEELGVEYDSEEFESQGRRGQRGRGGGRAKKEKDNAATAKEQIAHWRSELDDLLHKRINLGVSERYLAGGRVDVETLLNGKLEGTFLEGI